MPGLHLLKLPFLVRDIIIKCLTILEIFELSTASKRALVMMKQTKTNMGSISFDFSPARLSVTIQRAQETLCFWTHYQKKAKNVQYRQVDGSQVQLLEFKQTTENYLELIFNAEMETVESELEVLERITKHFYTFMKFGKTFLHFDKQQINLKDLFVWNCTQRFDRVSIPPMGCSSLKITSGELSFILKHVQAENMKLDVSISDQPGSKYQYNEPEPSKIQDLSIAHSNWVNLDNILMLDIQKITFNFPHGLFEKVNTLLKSWIAGENEKLEALTICPRSRFRTISSEAIFAGIPATPTVFTTENLRSRGQRGFVDSRDIRRAKDGLQATVCSFVIGISMIVWKEEHLRAIGKL